mgnify:CR=1 FL=1
MGEYLVRELRGDRGLLEERLAWIRERGVPNYFGAQRFGKAESNLHGAHVLFAGQAKRTPRHLRGLWLSASRAQIFNEVLALREAASPETARTLLEAALDQGGPAALALSMLPLTVSVRCPSSREIEL